MQGDCKERKDPADGVVFSLDLALWRTNQEAGNGFMDFQNGPEKLQ